MMHEALTCNTNDLHKVSSLASTVYHQAGELEIQDPQMEQVV